MTSSTTSHTQRRSGFISRPIGHAPMLLALAPIALATLTIGAGCAGSSVRGENKSLGEIDPARAYGSRRRQEALAHSEAASKLHAEGRDDKALLEYRQALELDDELYAAWNNMGQLLMSKGNYSDAVAAYKIAARLEPSDPRPEYNIGLAYQRVGWAQDSYAHFKESMGRDPNYMPALRGLIRSAEMLGKGDEETLGYIRAAQLRETDEAWRTYFTAQKYRVEAMIASQNPKD